MLQAICRLWHDFIEAPNYDKVQPFILDNAHKYRPWFDISTPLLVWFDFLNLCSDSFIVIRNVCLLFILQNCVEAIDSTHIPCVPPSERAGIWRNKMGFYSMNIMAACSFDMKFTYILSGWEGSVYDARVLQSVVWDPA